MNPARRAWLYSPALLALALAIGSGAAGEALAPWLLLAVLAAAVAWSAEQGQAEPLQRLARAAERLARGEAAGPLDEAAQAAPLAQALGAIEKKMDALRQELGALDAAGRRAQVELQSAEERYAAAVSGADDGLWDWDLRADTVFHSPRLRAMLGLGDESASGRSADWYGRVHPDDLPALKAAVDAHLAGATPSLLAEHRLRRADGREIWVLARGRAIRSAGGRAIRLVGLVTDISQRKRAEEILRGMAEGVASARGESFYQALVKSFAGVLRVRAAFVTQCLDPNVQRVRTLAFWDGERFLDAIEYDLANTPCDSVINGGQACFIADHLAERFPCEEGFESYLGIPIFDLDRRIIGHLACLGTLPMDDPLPHEPIFSVFASRAGMEMEYMAMAGRLAGR
ncbi:MAG TPA: PAS domain-containing protein [Thiobacillaceae bacterium]|nr:PAS domain-containing protein [Thiobacillaceae bacterium]